MNLDRTRDDRTGKPLGQAAVPRLSNERQEQLLSDLTESPDTELSQTKQETNDIETPEFAQLAFTDTDGN
ncbi:MAG: hypothetical protein J07HB67_01760 [halophilic archaeon J07HB67]|jgi:hypothetical protein|nr:MAG: hypothetical protein J07HB67_01760 [halophilic archaeon J07HB67]